MSILVVMIPLSILLLIGAGIAFFWAVEHHQFDDLDTPRLLPLLDDPSPPSPLPSPPPSAPPSSSRSAGAQTSPLENAEAAATRRPSAAGDGQR